MLNQILHIHVIALLKTCLLIADCSASHVVSFILNSHIKSILVRLIKCVQEKTCERQIWVKFGYRMINN